MKELILNYTPQDSLKNLTCVQEFSYCCFDHLSTSSIGRRVGLMHVFLSNTVLNDWPLKEAIRQAEANFKRNLQDPKTYVVTEVNYEEQRFLAINLLTFSEERFKFYEICNSEIIDELKPNIRFELHRGSETTALGGQRFYSVIEII